MLNVPKADPQSHINLDLFIATIGHTAYSRTTNGDLISTAYMACEYLMRHGIDDQEVLRAYYKLGEKLLKARKGLSRPL